MISVEEVRETVLPGGTVLLGGRNGLQRTVSGTATLRARTPAFPQLHGGELALVVLTLLRQLEARPRPDRLVGQLADAGVASIVLLDAVDSDRPLLDVAATAADEHRLPVFLAPRHHTADSIDAALHRYLSQRREALLRRSQEIQQELATLALAGRGLPATLERLAAISGLAAAWEDSTLELRAWAPPPAVDQGEWPAGIAGLVRSGRLPLQRWANSLRTAPATDVAVLPLRANRDLHSAPWRRLVVPVMVGGQVAGYLSLIAPQGAPDQDARLALAGAGLAASIEALRLRTVSEAQGNATVNLIRDWLAGRFESSTELLTRATQLGHTLTAPYAVLAVEAGRDWLPDELERLAVAVAEGVSGTPAAGRTTRSEASPAPFVSLDDRRMVMIVPVALDTDLQGRDVAVHTVLASFGDAPLYAGLERPAASVDEVPRAYREALQATAIARRLQGRHRAAYFGTLGVYRVLAAVSPVGELLSFYQDTLGALVAHDQKTGGELVRTLDAYIACGGSPLDAAQRLHTHRNTVLYRLERIVEVLGVDVRQPEQRLVCHLTLRASEVLGELRAESHEAETASPPVRAAGKTRNGAGAPGIPATHERRATSALRQVPPARSAARRAGLGR